MNRRKIDEMKIFGFRVEWNIINITLNLMIQIHVVYMVKLVLHPENVSRHSARSGEERMKEESHISVVKLNRVIYFVRQTFKYLTLSIKRGSQFQFV